MRHRIHSIADVGQKLPHLGIPIFQPTGGQAVYLDAKSFLPHIPPQENPGQALVCALYLQGGIRSCEIGSVMFGQTDPRNGTFKPAKLELVRLAIPRRVYTQSHMDYVVECIGEIFQKRNTIQGMRLTYAPSILRHFTAQFGPL
ncbi:MAG: hypothetical protein JSW39_14470 [Desulfobacterales bacterium]|nr:MAG: hypothetical protein JSW39_14470 [Desulfobacterales bacterium]